MRRWLGAGLVAVGSLGCGGFTPELPAPAPTPVPASPLTGIIQGFATLNNGVGAISHEGIRVEVVSGADAGTVTTTAARGEYSVSLRPGAVRLRWSKPTSSQWTPHERDFVVTAGETITYNFRFDLATGVTWTVQGTVVDGRGMPVAGARTGAYDANYDLPAFAETLTDTQGRFVLSSNRVPSPFSRPGPIRVSAFKDGYVPMETSVTCCETQTQFVVDLRMLRVTAVRLHAPATMWVAEVRQVTATVEYDDGSRDERPRLCGTGLKSDAPGIVEVRRSECGIIEAKAPGVATLSHEERNVAATHQIRVTP